MNSCAHLRVKLDGMYVKQSEIFACAFLWWAKMLRNACSVFVSRLASVFLRIESGISYSRRKSVVEEEPVLS